MVPILDLKKLKFMKKLFIILIILSGLSVFGQGFGVEMGLTPGKFIASVEETVAGMDVSHKWRTGFTLKIDYDLPVTDFIYVSPGLSYIQKGSVLETSYMENGDQWHNVYKFSTGYLQFPVLLKFHFPLNRDFTVGLQGGGFYATALGGRLYYEYFRNGQSVEKDFRSLQFGTDTNDDFIRSDVGIIAGATVYYQSFSFTLEYQRGVTNILTDYDVYFTSLIAIRLGYRFYRRY